LSCTCWIGSVKIKWNENLRNSFPA
jgi:hypothetical protein